MCSILKYEFKAIITAFQHGFFTGRSTSTNLVSFTNYAVDTIESGAQLDVIYTDFSKAFDRISHKLLLRKLSDIGVHSSLLKWIQSYLEDRRQFVKIGDFVSYTFDVRSGVPQGSHLGPLFFIIFVNDIVKIFEYAACEMYADDLKVFMPIRTIDDALKLQTDLDRLSEWCNNNSLFLNVSKCKAMTFHRKRIAMHFAYQLNRADVCRVDEIKDLGVMFDEKLSFNKHIDMVISKAYSTLGFVMRVCSEFRDPLVLKSLYFAHVRSILEYASVVWSPNFITSSNKIESIQKKFLRFVFRRFGWYNVVQYAPYAFKRGLLGIESLETRRRNADALFVFDLILGHIDAPNLLDKIDLNVPSRDLRGRKLLRTRRHRTTYGLSEPISRISSISNSVGHVFDFNLSRTTIRNRLKSLSS